MIELGISPFVLTGFLIYAALSFLIAIIKPTIGLYSLVPIVGLGFEDSGLLKGGLALLIWAAIFIHILITRRKLQVSGRIKFFLFIFFVYLLLVFSRIFLEEGSAAFWLQWIAARLGAPLSFVFLIIFFLKEKRELVVFLYVIIGFTFVTATVAILQFFNISDFFWQMREALGVPKSIAYFIENKTRVSGLSSYVVPLSYQLLSVIPLLTVFSIVKVKLFLPKIVIVLITTTISIALMLTFMRAAILGVFIGVFIVFILMFRSKLSSRFSAVFFPSLLLFLFTIVISQGNIYQGIFRLDESVFERIPVTIAASKILAMNPLGVGSKYSEGVKDIYSDIEYYPRAELALVLFPHNIFLNVGILFGWMAIILVIIFYVLLFKQLYKTTQDNDKVLRAVSIGLIGSLAAYLINAMFHNASPFVGDPFNWFFLGSAFWVIIHSQKNMPSSSPVSVPNIVPKATTHLN